MDPRPSPPLMRDPRPSPPSRVGRRRSRVISEPLNTYPSNLVGRILSCASPCPEICRQRPCGWQMWHHTAPHHPRVSAGAGTDGRWAPAVLPQARMANVLRYVNDVRPKVDAIMMSAYALARVRIDWPAQSGLDGPARGACVPPCAAVSAELSPLWGQLQSPAQSFCHELILFCSFFFFLRQLCSRSAAGLRQL